MNLSHRNGFNPSLASLSAAIMLLPQQASAVDQAVLAKQLNDPIAALISVPIKLDRDTGSAPKTRTATTISCSR